MHFFEREKLYRICKVIPLNYVTQRLKIFVIDFAS